MKLLVVADIYGDITSLNNVLSEAEKHGPDVVICPGNMTDMFKPHTDFSQMDIAELIIQKLVSLGKPVLCIPGNHDPVAILDLFDDYGVNIHSKHLVVGGVDFMGFGGAKTPFNTNFEPGEEETAATLGNLLQKSKPQVFVVHNPPKDTKLDAVSTGEHVGSQAVREFIEKASPKLVITAHIHEARGQDFVGDSVIFNPGPCFEGRYGLVNMEKNGVKCNSMLTAGKAAGANQTP